MAADWARAPADGNAIDTSAASSMPSAAMDCSADPEVSRPARAMAEKGDVFMASGELGVTNKPQVIYS